MTSRNHEIELRFRDRSENHERQRAFTARGFGIERVQMDEPLSFDYAWSGDAHYLAMHDIMLSEGEITADGKHRSNLHDLRDRLTFAPKGMPIEGWSTLRPRRNCYLALTFAPDLLEQEGRQSELAHHDRPHLYFFDRSLRDTFRKLDRLMRDPTPVDPMMAETLGMLAVFELDRLLSGQPAERTQAQLSERQLSIVLDYVEAHLDEPITLDTLAQLGGLSRYHFARAFSATTGASPVQFVRERRLERAEVLLRTTAQDLASIAKAVGFGGQQQFANAFRRQHGCSPSAYRRSVKN
jgi:AraC family transcriptional regulator